jgi:ubiquitin-protein ligase
MAIPLELLKRRVRNELKILEGMDSVEFECMDGPAMDFPYSIDIHLTGVKGMDRERDGRVVERSEHRFRIVVYRDYPVLKPGIIWQSGIFHPNISAPESGGIVCTKLLQEWRAERTLSSLITAIAHLIEHPNRREPLGFESCESAVRYLAELDKNEN